MTTTRRPALPSDRDIESGRILAAQWARIGGGLAALPAEGEIDVERLTIETLHFAPVDPRLYGVMIAWLSVLSVFVDHRRLGRLLDDIGDETGRDPAAALTSAVGGAAVGIVAGRGGPTAKAATTLQQYCRPLQPPRALSDRVAKSRVLKKIARDECLPVFSRSGLRYHEITDARDSTRSIAGVLASAPGLRIRSGLRTDLSVEIVAHLIGGSASIASMVVRTGATRIAVSDAVPTLIARGPVTNARRIPQAALTHAGTRALAGSCTGDARRVNDSGPHGANPGPPTRHFPPLRRF